VVTPLSLSRMKMPITDSCKALTKSGKPCKAVPLANGLCLFHSGRQNPVQLGRKGGRKNRHTIPDGESTPLTPPQTASDVKVSLANLMSDVKHGRVEPKIANCCAYIASSLLKAIEVGDLEERIAKLEEASSGTGATR
jgi:hypothetical protein